MHNSWSATVRATAAGTRNRLLERGLRKDVSVQHTTATTGWDEAQRDRMLSKNSRQGEEETKPDEKLGLALPPLDAWKT